MQLNKDSRNKESNYLLSLTTYEKGLCLCRGRHPTDGELALVELEKGHNKMYAYKHGEGVAVQPCAPNQTHSPTRCLGQHGGGTMRKNQVERTTISSLSSPVSGYWVCYAVANSVFDTAKKTWQCIHLCINKCNVTDGDSYLRPRRLISGEEPLGVLRRDKYSFVKKLEIDK